MSGGEKEVLLEKIADLIAPGADTLLQSKTVGEYLNIFTQINFFNKGKISFDPGSFKREESLALPLKQPIDPEMKKIGDNVLTRIKIEKDNLWLLLITQGTNPTVAAIVSIN